MVEKIISGGQTGVDRAALDFAIKVGIPHGGWIIRGRLAEDGAVGQQYQLQEIGSRSYPIRTKRNIEDSDGTLIFSDAGSEGGMLRRGSGTQLTASYAEQVHKPLYVVRLDEEQDMLLVRDWIDRHQIRTLNVAGPRESRSPGIYQKVVRLLHVMHQRKVF